MTTTQFDRFIAHRTGDTLSSRPNSTGRLEAEEVRLVVDCPFCGRAVPYPGRVRDGSSALAECLDPRCDIYFDFAEADVHAA